MHFFCFVGGGEFDLGGMQMFKSATIFSKMFLISDGGDGLSSCHQPDGSPAGVQLNHLRQGALLRHVSKRFK